MSTSVSDSADKLILSLKGLSSVQVNDKLCVTPEGYLVRDDRLLQPVIRFISGDSRTRLLDNISELLSVLSKYLCKDINKHDDWRRKKVIDLLPLALRGLENIRATYQADTITRFRLEHAFDTLEQIYHTVSR